MKSVLYLKDYKERALELAIERNNMRPIGDVHHYSVILIKVALEELAQHNLKYNIERGKTYLDRKVVSEYTYKKEIPTYDNEDDVIYDHFTNYILNSTYRLSRGYEAI